MKSAATQEKKTPAPAAFFLQLVLLVGIVGALLCGGILLFLNVSVGKSFLNERVKKRTGIEFTYDHLFPLSLNSIAITGFQALPQQCLEIERIQVRVNLKQSLKTRSLAVEGLEVVQPTLHIQAEPLLQLMKTALKKKAGFSTPSSVTRSGETPSPSIPVPGTPQAGSSSPPEVSPPATNLPPPQRPASPLVQSPSSVPTAPPMRMALPALSFSEGTVLLSSSQLPEDVFILEGLSFHTDGGSLNQSGDGTLRAVTLLGKKVPLGLSQPVKLDGRQLFFPETVHALPGGIELRMGGRVSLNQLLAFQGGVFLTIPEKTTFAHPLLPPLRLTVEKAQALFKASGVLVSPQSITATLKTSCPSTDIEFQGKDTHHFTEQLTEVSLRGGQLMMPRAHFKSEELSLMGNGLLLSSGKGNAVFRVVSNETWKRRYSLLTNGLMLPPDAKEMEELDTPDRYVKDFFLQLSPEHTTRYRFSGNDEWTALDFLLNRLKSFLIRELGEE